VSPETLTPEERRAILFAPITRGILAERTIGGKATCGAGTDGSKSPVTDVDGKIVGWQRMPMKQH
jgi:hypothetical protein